MNRYQQRQNSQVTAGLTRYQSAPTSLFSDILNCNGGDGGRFGDDDFARLFNPNASSPETQRIFSRFMNSTGTVSDGCSLNTTVQSQSQHLPPVKIEADSNSTPIRQGSLPAGIFSSIRIENSMMDTISETGNKGLRGDNSGFPLNPLDDFLKELADHDFDTFDKKAKTSDDQNNDGANRPRNVLSHHLSLPPKSSAMKKLLEDLGPCKLRAKRGCATHPRSIAERVRRNKISEKMRKLQELVPNMEMQTNTANMLDLAADYIKDLQRQVKTLSDNRTKCCCSAKLKM